MFLLRLLSIVNRDTMEETSTHDKIPMYIIFSQTFEILKTLLKSRTEIDKNERQEWSVGLPTIFAITPTYQRFLQKAELTRVSNTFHLVPNFHWIVVEDSAEKTRLVENFLNQSGLDFTHLNIRTPRLLRRSKSKPRWTKSRGLEQRNKALDWLRENVNPNTTRGVVYFADDDNTYDRKLFEEVDVQTNK